MSITPHKKDAIKYRAWFSFSLQLKYNPSYSIKLKFKQTDNFTIYVKKKWY